jgi:hypothetical protein
VQGRIISIISPITLKSTTQSDARFTVVRISGTELYFFSERCQLTHVMNTQYWVVEYYSYISSIPVNHPKNLSILWFNKYLLNQNVRKS